MTTPNMAPKMFGVVDLRVFKMLSDVAGSVPTYDPIGIDMPGVTAITLSNGSSTVEGKGDERVLEIEYIDDKSDVGFDVLYLPMAAMAMINGGVVDSTTDVNAATYYGPGYDDIGEYFRVEAVTKSRKEKLIIYKVKGRLFPEGMKGTTYASPSFKGTAIHTTGNVNGIAPRRFSVIQAQYSMYLGGAQQVETATVVGAVTTAGNAAVTVTSAGLVGSPIAITVAVAVADSATVVAQKIREALNLNTAITNMFVVGGTGVNVTTTAITPAVNDVTQNIAIAPGTSVGITAAPTSTNTTIGQLPV